MASMTTIASSTLTSATLSSTTAAASILITVVLAAKPTTMSTQTMFHDAFKDLEIVFHTVLPATAPATTSIVATMVETHCLKPAWQLLVALHDQLHQVLWKGSEI